MNFIIKVMSLKIKRIIFQSVWSLLSLLITAMIIGSLVYIYLSSKLPNVDILKDVHMQVPLRVFSADGKLMAEFGSKKRIPVTLDQVPLQMIHAVLAVEDARYYHHAGVDFIGLIRAAKAVILTGRKVQGASTITMQVARNFFLTRKKTYSRKINEILLALKINRELSKDKVLELYLNKVYFGKRAYGIATAAQIYYGKKLSQLTLAQMAMLAGLPQAPSRENPLVNPKKALKRRNHVLTRMLEVHFINDNVYQTAIATPLTASYHGSTIKVKAPYFADLVRQLMVKEFGSKAYDMGLTVTTTLSSTLQQDARQSLQQGLINYSKRHGYIAPTRNLSPSLSANHSSWLITLNSLARYNQLTPAAVISTQAQTIQALLANGDTITIPWSGLAWARTRIDQKTLGPPPKLASDILKIGDIIQVQKIKTGWVLSQVPEVQGALISMDPTTGAITAMTGGFDYQLSKFNRATQARRQAGSSFKPFIYSAALAKGYTLASIINDAPVVMQDSGENSLWRPQNDTMKFYGPTSLRVGLTKSRNLVSIRLLQEIGIPYTLNYAQKFGFDVDQLPHSLSLALGSASVSPLQLAAGYSVFANGGFKSAPYFIQKITSETRQVLFVHPSLPQPISAVSTNDLSNQHSDLAHDITPQNAYIMTQVLKGVIQTGTGRAAKILNRKDLAGKTGTTNKQMDAWFAGFNSHNVTTVWVGYDSLITLHEYGAQAALPIWIHFMGDALQGTASATMEQPPGILMARIDPENGLLAKADQAHARFEYFRKKYMPSQYSQASSSLSSNVSLNKNKLNSVTQENDDEPLF